MICPMCGRQTGHTIEEYKYRESGLDNVFVSGVGIYRCKCGQEYVQLPGVQEVHAQVASALLKKASLLTGPESKFLRKWLRLTSEVMAQALGYTRVTVSRWENDGPPAKTDRALRLYASAVRNISIDFENLFPSMNDKPQKNFRIVVVGSRTVPQYSAGVSMSASAIVAARSSAQETLADFTGFISVTAETAQAANQELAQAA